MDPWVDGWTYVKSQPPEPTPKEVSNLDLIEIIQFCFKIYDLWRHPHP